MKYPRSLWVDLYLKKEQKQRYNDLKAWHDENGEERRLFELVENLRAAMKESSLQSRLPVLPDYCKYFLKAQKGRINSLDNDQLQLFYQIVADHAETDINTKCWESVFAIYLNHYGSFNTNTMAEVYDSVMRFYSAKLYASVTRVDINRARAHKFLQDIILYRSRLDIETGNITRVVALLQALGEFHYHCPKQYQHKTFDFKFDALKRFYEHGFPRFAEEGAQGWVIEDINASERNRRKESERTTLEESFNETLRDEKFIVQEYISARKPLGELWADVEHWRSSKYWMPLKFDQTNANVSLPNMFVSLDSLKTTLEAVHEVKYAPFLILRLLQVLGASFGSMPIKLKKEVLENESLSNVIMLLLPEMTEFQNKYTGLYDFLINYMFELCKVPKDLHQLHYHLVLGIVETLRLQLATDGAGDLTEKLEAVREKFDAVFRTDKTHLNEKVFAAVKLLELEADMTMRENSHNPGAIGFPANWVDLGDESAEDFVKSPIFERMIALVNGFASSKDRMDRGDRSIVFYAALQILKRLDSDRNMSGALRRPKPFYSRSRFLVLFLSVTPRALNAFKDRNFEVLSTDVEAATKCLKELFEKDKFDESLESADVIGTSQDLCLQLYNIIYYEDQGRSLYHEFYCPSMRAEGDEDKTSIKTKVYSDLSFFQFSNRLDMCEKLASNGRIPYGHFNKWALDMLRGRSHHALVWRCALPAIRHNHLLTELLSARNCCNLDSARRSVLHSLLVFASHYKNYNNKQQLVTLRKTLNDAISSAQELPFPESTIPRLSLLTEIRSDTEQAMIDKLYRKTVVMFPFAKACSFDVLSGFSSDDHEGQIKLKGVADLLEAKGYRCYVSKDELEELYRGGLEEVQR